MVWFKVDDKMHSHPKARKAGVEAMGLWVLCGSWSSDQLTDGFIPDYIAASFAPRNFEKLAAALVKAGMWEEDMRDDDQGWTFHGWDERNPTKAAVETKREEDRERKADWREKKKAKAAQAKPRVPKVSQRDNRVRHNGTTASVTEPSQESPLYPDPTRPDPLIPTTSGGELSLVPPNAGDLVAEWIDHCQERPPSRVIGHVSRELKQLIDDGIDYEQIRAGLAMWARKSLHPSALASVVHEAGNPRQQDAGRQTKAQTNQQSLMRQLEIARQLDEQEGIA